jgi:hypothetical protein
VGNLKLIAYIITKDNKYIRECPYEWRKPIWDICCATLKQLDSEQYILSRGFVKLLIGDLKYGSKKW